MARGWESKAVEEQQAAAAERRQPTRILTPEQVASKYERDSLVLSRNRVLTQLKVVQNPVHRQMLETALAELDARLTRLS